MKRRARILPEKSWNLKKNINLISFHILGNLSSYKNFIVRVNLENTLQTKSLNPFVDAEDEVPLKLSKQELQLRSFAP